MLKALQKLRVMEGHTMQDLILIWANEAWELKRPLREYVESKIEEITAALDESMSDAMTSADIEKMVNFRKKHNIEF